MSNHHRQVSFGQKLQTWGISQSWLRLLDILATIYSRSISQEVVGSIPPAGRSRKVFHPRRKLQRFFPSESVYFVQGSHQCPRLVPRSYEVDTLLKFIFLFSSEVQHWHDPCAIYTILAWCMRDLYNIGMIYVRSIQHWYDLCAIYTTLAWFMRDLYNIGMIHARSIQYWHDLCAIYTTLAWFMRDLYNIGMIHARSTQYWHDLCAIYTTLTWSIRDLYPPSEPVIGGGIRTWRTTEVRIRVRITAEVVLTVHTALATLQLTPVVRAIVMECAPIFRRHPPSARALRTAAASHVDILHFFTYPIPPERHGVEFCEVGADIIPAVHA